MCTVENSTVSSDGTETRDWRSTARELVKNRQKLASFLRELRRLGVSEPLKDDAPLSLDSGLGVPAPIARLGAEVMEAVPEGGCAVRFSVTFRSGEKAHAEHTLRALMDFQQLNPRQVLGVIGRPDARRTGGGWHLYALAVVDSPLHVSRLKRALTGIFDGVASGQKAALLGRGKEPTLEDFVRCVQYLLKPLPDYTDPTRDVRASGLLSGVWTVRRNGVMGCSVRYCAHCGKALSPKATRRRTFCKDSCRKASWARGEARRLREVGRGH